MTALGDAFRVRRLGEPDQAVSNHSGAALADSLDCLQVSGARTEKSLQRAEVLDQPVSEIGRQAVDLRHLTEPAGGDVSFQVHVVREPAARATVSGSSSSSVSRCSRPARPNPMTRWAIVPLEQAAQLVDPRAELMQLQGEQAAVVPSSTT